MWKSRLFTPGPTAVPDEILLEMAKPLIHHRTPQFRRILVECFSGLKEIFQTKEDVIILTSSGTGAMEAAVSNLLSPGEKCLVIEGGKFGERWREIPAAYGIKVTSLAVEWGKSVAPEEIEDALRKEPDIKAVFTTLCETSTGAHTDVKAISEVTGKFPDVLHVVDGISGLGAVECRTDEWGIDVMVSASQKGFMLPPGLAFISLNQRAWERVARCQSPRYYFDLAAYRKALTKEDTPYTPGLTLVIGLAAALRMLKAEGVENVWKRHFVLAEAMREAVKALGLRLLAENPSNVVTAVWAPAGVDAETLTKALRDGYGITFAGGQGKLKGKIFRIAHLGWIDRFEIIEAVAALEIQMAKMGYTFALGAGCGAAEKVFLATP